MIVSISGISGSGKSTLATALVKYLVDEKKYEDVKYLHFPNYETDIGLLLKNYDSNDVAIPPFRKWSLYQLNRHEFMDEYVKYATEQKKILVVEPSYLNDWSIAILDGVTKLEYNIIMQLSALIPRSIQFTIDVPAQLATERIEKQEDREDKKIFALDKLEAQRKIISDLSLQLRYIILDGRKPIDELLKDVIPFVLY
jgi:thymidylate kinase